MVAMLNYLFETFASDKMTDIFASSPLLKYLLDPFRFHEVSWVRTPLVANVFYALLKPIMSKEFRDKVQLGVKFDESFDGRLDTLFLQQTHEIANERQVMTVKSFLKKRYYNDRHFRL